jgi:dephospho-CoA kinase
MTSNKVNSLKALSDLIATVHQLRAPGGCPWDRAQTHQSLRQYLIEEAYEVLEVLDQIEKPKDLKSEKIKSAFKEELGDLFMQVLLHSEMANEEGAFDIYEVAKALDEKLIRRHPHVFGKNKTEEKVGTESSALASWEKEKAKEKASDLNASILDGVPRGLPALQKASRVLEKVTQVGFQWNDMEGPIEKVEEELAELKVEILKLEKLAEGQDSTAIKKRVEDEMGDLFFTLCNISYLMKVNPEAALRGTLDRFQRRFRHVERKLKEKGKTPEQSDLQEMDLHWVEAKELERVQVWGLTGGVASGKSTIGKIFSELGIPVIDADQIAKELTQKGSPAERAIFKRFGTSDRKLLRDIIFTDAQARRDLEAILHPLIQIESTKQIEDLSLKCKVILYEATLLVETGRYRDFTGLITVEAPEDMRINRLQARDSLNRETAERIIHSQLPDTGRRKHSDIILENAGTEEDLRNKIQDLIENRGWE